jgi:hypothetical protein
MYTWDRHNTHTHTRKQLTPEVDSVVLLELLLKVLEEKGLGARVCLLAGNVLPALLAGLREAPSRGLDVCALGDKGGPLLAVARLREREVQAVEDVRHLCALHLQLDALREELLAGGGLDLGHAGLCERAHLHDVDAAAAVGIELCPALRGELLHGHDVDLVDDHDQGLVCEERADVLKEGDLLLKCVPALPREVHDVQHARAQMGERGDGLHLDGVAVLERVVENAGRVDDLPAQVLVLGVAHKERLCGEGVRLDLDVCARDLVDEARLAHVREPGHKERSRVGVDRGQTREMLADLLEVGQRRRQALHQRAHAAERRPLKLLAPVQRVAVLEQPDVVLPDVVDHVHCSVHLPERELVVVLVVQHIHQVRVEGVHVVHLGELYAGGGV